MATLIPRMDEQQRLELTRIRQEQRALRAALETLEARLSRLSESEPKPEPELPTPAPPPPPRPVPAPAPAGDLEVRLGAKWLVRMAVIMLVAALAFLANYLYQNIIPHLGAGAKVGLLYLGAGAITGAGFLLERSRQARDHAGLLNYSRVLLAGGLAAVYYVTYAAHHYDRLRVIESPLVAACLLLGWTAFMTWLADRRASQTLAAFSILLAYFAAATSDVTGFTLVANLGLTAAAVFLVMRQRWPVFSFASLAATYGSYAFWWYGDWLSPGGSGRWLEGAFLACYWGLFTFAAFYDRRQALAGAGARAAFVTLNNGAFYALVSLLVSEEAQWCWPLALGAALLALGELGRRLARPLDAPAVDAYHFAGVAFVTLGCVQYFSGWQLSVILAVESATVLAAACWRRSWPLFVAAYFVALLATMAALDLTLVRVGAREHWLAGTACGAILLFNAWQCRRFPRERPGPGEGYYSALGLAIWFAVLEMQITGEIWRAPLLAGAALALTAGLYPLRIPAALALAQLYLLAAHGHWLAAYAGAPRAKAPPLWNPAAVLGVTVALGAVAHRLKQGPTILYESGAFFLFAVVSGKYFEGAQQWTALIAGGAAVLALGYAMGQPRLRGWSLGLSGLGMLSIAGDDAVRGLACLPTLGLLAAQAPLVRRFGRTGGMRSRRFEGALISLAVLCGWIWITRQLPRTGPSSFTLAAAWSLYGGVLFGAGIALRERFWRWWGLGVLGTALGHIVLFDIWTLGNLERFISLFVISLVLLAIGFFYNRLSSSIREWF